VIIDQLGIDIVPFTPLLIIPVLGRMSDHCEPVRLMAMTCFGLLMRLMPLDVSRMSAEHTFISVYHPVWTPGAARKDLMGFIVERQATVSIA